MSNIIPFNKPYREHVSPALDAGLIAVRVGLGTFWTDMERKMFRRELARMRSERDGGPNDAP